MYRDLTLSGGSERLIELTELLKLQESGQFSDESVKIETTQIHCVEDLNFPPCFLKKSDLIKRYKKNVNRNSVNRTKDQFLLLKGREMQ